ncbi:piggyBac transposable element-derived protein 4 [Biomphalaria pfeifferi]|uniref:PiggyBac transposable element-derived protein 4 n=1 Tax=Biomphalaria pfeifferi TaxID=112525 RepID=A0AAD8B2G1_BIOPF|nr:piggyBac transposable element-derived protein 4 [Biomphalaria pfeifferi]
MQRRSTSIDNKRRRFQAIDVLRAIIDEPSDDDDGDEGSETEDEVIQDICSADEDTVSDAATDLSLATGAGPSTQNIETEGQAEDSDTETEGDTRIPQRNKVTGQPGNKGEARDISSGILAWSLFFTDDLLNDIVTHTNAEIVVQRRRYANDRQPDSDDDDDDAEEEVRPSFTRNVDIVELKALLGLYYLAGVLNMNGVTTYELFDKDCGVAYFRATMPQKRFTFLTNCIRFDDKGTRQEKRERDRLAPIRELFDTPSEYCTVDEQLLAFRGRCPFKMYIPSKPDKYGIKIMMMCDSKNYYMCNAEVYTGKGSTPAGVSATEYYSVQMTTPIHGTNRNCTFDNWFTSINTARKLYDDHAVTMVGTMKKNKAEIPPSFVELRGREKNSAMFAFSGVFTLLSYCPPKPKKKIVMLLSTMHRQGDTKETVRLPDMVQFYNETKCGVDTFDQLCHRYSVSRRTRRWPLTVFCGLLNAVGINSMILLKGSHADDKEAVPDRRTYLKTLAKALIKPQMEARLRYPKLSKNLRSLINGVLKIEPAERAQARQAGGRAGRIGRCSFCDRFKDRKSKTKCCRCDKLICASHQHTICPDCADD